MNPYLAGIGIGLVLLASFVLMGRGLGATGAFSSLQAWLVQMFAPEHAQANAVYSDYLGDSHLRRATTRRRSVWTRSPRTLRRRVARRCGRTVMRRWMTGCKSRRIGIWRRNPHPTTVSISASIGD